VNYSGKLSIINKSQVYSCLPVDTIAVGFLQTDLCTCEVSVSLQFRWVQYLQEKLGFWFCNILITSAKTLSLYQFYCFTPTLRF